MILLRASVFFLIFALALNPAWAETAKIALIISNKDYPSSVGRLENTHRDGELIGAALRELGFTVVHKRDVTREQMTAEVAGYVGRLSEAGPNSVGFFYYSGHGAANSKYGENYLIPVAAPLTSDTQLPLLGVKLGDVVDAIGATPSKANFVVFDACRNVPNMSVAVKSASKGMARVENRRGLLLAFATEPGNVALDQSAYATALAETIKKPGVEAVQVFREVRRRVLAATERRQFPWTAEGLEDDFYFAPGKGNQTAAPQDSGETQIAIAPLLNLAPQPGPADVKAAAAFNLRGEEYYHGANGFQKDHKKAFEQFRLGANLGHGAAITSLATMYDNGEGVERNEAEALRLYLRAADLGEVRAIYNLGWKYNNAEGVAKNDPEAVRLYKRAADMGHLSATTNLAMMYSNGEGVPKNEAEAVRLYRVAADKKHPSAMSNLGYMHETGKGVRKDMNEAKAWYKKAADLGDDYAKKALKRVGD